MNTVRTAAKFLAYGLVIGILFAPRSGQETRQHLLGWAQDMFKGQ